MLRHLLSRAPRALIRAPTRRPLSATPAFSDISLTELTGADAGTAVLTLARPAARNALSISMLRELSAALATVSARAAASGGGGPLRALVVASSAPAPGAFCAGADLKERATLSPAAAAAVVDSIRAAFAALAALPLPTVAAVEGPALGGGTELALACDFRIAGAGAAFGLPETALAIIPGAGGTARLPRLIGAARAKELIFSARRVGAEEAKALGLACALAPAGGALDAALALARTFVGSGPVALRAAKEAIDAGGDADAEARAYARVLPTADRLEGLAAFREKRKPVYRGV
jgi:methylglutaconyl-CoA hydratase